MGQLSAQAQLEVDPHELLEQVVVLEVEQLQQDVVEQAHEEVLVAPISSEASTMSMTSKVVTSSSFSSWPSMSADISFSFRFVVPGPWHRVSHTTDPGRRPGSVVSQAQLLVEPQLQEQLVVLPQLELDVEQQLEVLQELQAAMSSVTSVSSRTSKVSASNDAISVVS